MTCAKSVKKTRVAVALSGGVDSSVAAALLKEQGFDVIAVFMDCEQKGTGCDIAPDRRMALRAAAKLDIPFRVFELRRAYRQKVLDYFYAEYRAGRTPNPDVMCNKEIKFGLFLEKALCELKVDMIATGHYVCSELTGGAYHLRRARDESKDQSYFLYTLNQKQLAKALFPVGDLTKQEVRRKARQLKLPNWDRPDSQGICFVGEVKLFDFLRHELREKSGAVLNEHGEETGRHRGVWFYTVGQRHGFTVNKYQGVPLYVIGKDVKKNTLLVGPRKQIFRQEFTATNLNWIQGESSEGDCLIRIRHLGELIPGKLKFASVLSGEGQRGYKKGGTNLSQCLVKLDRPAFAVSPGQSAVFYRGDELLGGGVISYLQ